MTATKQTPSQQLTSSVHFIALVVEDQEVKLRSNYRASGDGISYWFSGKMEGEKLVGSVFIGESVTANFSAKRVEYRKEYKRIAVPGGLPLATLFLTFN